MLRLVAACDERRVARVMQSIRFPVHRIHGIFLSHFALALAHATQAMAERSPEESIAVRLSCWDVGHQVHSRVGAHRRRYSVVDGPSTIRSWAELVNRRQGAGES
jgi:hypothetical protein